MKKFHGIAGLGGVELPRDYSCSLFFERELAPGAHETIAAARANYTPIDDSLFHRPAVGKKAVAADLDSIKHFRAHGMVATEPAQQLYVRDITSCGRSQFPRFVVERGGTWVRFFEPDALGRGGDLRFDTCAPREFVIDVENRGTEPATFGLRVDGKCIFKEGFPK